MCLFAGTNQFSERYLNSFAVQSLQEVCNRYSGRDFAFHSKLQVQIQRHQKF